MKTTHASFLVLALLAASCAGRDPEISKMNEEALNGGSEGEGEGEGEGEQVRQLVTRELFGKLDLENRFLDPLFSLGSNGWFAVSADFSNYGVVYMRPMQTPTETRALELGGARDNPNGVALIGSYKSARGPQTVSIWVGRDAALPALEDVTASIIGLFVDGGEQSIDLVADSDNEQRIGDTVWTQLSAVLEEGPIGWGTLYLESDATDGVLVAGPLALDRAPGAANTLVRFAPKRALDAREQLALQVLKDRARDRLARPAPRVTLR